MRYLVISIVLLLLSSKSEGSTFAAEQDRMVKETTKAIGKYAVVRGYTRNGLNYIRRKSGMGKRGIAITEAAIVSAITGRISTNHLKWGIRKGNLTIKPKINYWFKSRNTAASANLIWTFK